MTVKFEGVKVTLGQQTYVVPALTIKQVRSMSDDIGAIKVIVGEPTPGQIDSMLRIVQAAVSRNYPDMTVEQLEEVVDLNSLPVVMKAINGQSGLERVKPGEA